MPTLDQAIVAYQLRVTEYEAAQEAVDQAEARRDACKTESGLARQAIEASLEKAP